MIYFCVENAETSEEWTLQLFITLQPPKCRLGKA